ncbi:MAG: hypothetical protein ACAH12_03620 [Methylophilaceae bacterium]
MQYFKKADGGIYRTDSTSPMEANDQLASEVEISHYLLQHNINEAYARVNIGFEFSMQGIVDTYPRYEIDSWSKQEAEARAFVVDASTVTPLIDALALARDIPKVDLVDRIILKADAFAAFSGQLIGKRQSYEDQINQIVDSEVSLESKLESIDAIVWQ